MPNGSIDTTRRTAERLRAARERLGLSKSEAASRVGLTRRELTAYENGRWRVPDTTMARLAQTYGLDVGEVVPSRASSLLEIDADRVSAGEAERRIPDGATPDEVLGEYLDLVRELRGVQEGDEIPLRDADLAVLAEALGGTEEAIEARLVELIDCTRDEARAIRKALMKRRLVAPAAGFLLGVGGLAPSVAGAEAPTPSAPATPVAQVSEAPPVEEPLEEVADEVQDVLDDVPAEDPAEDTEDSNTGDVPAEDPADERGEDWAEIIEPLVIENPDVQ